MKRITDIKELQSIQLGILKHFINFCETNNLRYQLAYGSVLGAVRHCGFIPWDDDIDVMMPREDFMRLVDLYDNTVQPIYKFESIYNRPDYYAPLAKMRDNRTILEAGYGYEAKNELGVYIDLFVIDKLPKGKGLQIFHYKLCQAIRYLWKMSILQYSAKSSSALVRMIKVPLMFLCKIIGYKNWIKAYERVAQIFKNSKSNYSGVIVYGEGINKEAFINEQFDKYSLLKFEDQMMRVPYDYKDYLIRMYGDYMKLPPVEERKVHPSEAYWKEGCGE